MWIFDIANSVIVDNENYGVRIIDGNATISWCKLQRNGRYAIRHDGEGLRTLFSKTQIFVRIMSMVYIALTRHQGP